jgi:hypothetical protein
VGTGGRRLAVVVPVVVVIVVVVAVRVVVVPATGRGGLVVVDEQSRARRCRGRRRGPSFAPLVHIVGRDEELLRSTDFELWRQGAGLSVCWRRDAVQQSEPGVSS